MFQNPKSTLQQNKSEDQTVLRNIMFHYSDCYILYSTIMRKVHQRQIELKLKVD